jgi:hypothetical protein
MFKHFLPFAISALAVTAFFACKQDKPAVSTAPVTITDAKLNAQDCVHDSVCASISLVLPQLSGGSNPAAVAAINDSLRILALSGLEINPKLALQPGFDSSMLDLFNGLKEHIKMSPDWSGGYTREVTGKNLWQSPQFVSFETNATSFTGGAHGSYATVLGTYDLSSGKSVELLAVVKDTAALVPMLEAGFVEAKKDGTQEVKLSDLLFEEFKRLPVTTNFCILKEGILFFYNPYEVASWAVGSTPITLTWEQLGALADKKKWVE